MIVAFGGSEERSSEGVLSCVVVGEARKCGG